MMADGASAEDLVSAEEIPSSAVEVRLEFPSGWPGAAFPVHVSAEDDTAVLAKMKVSLLTLEGQSVAEAVPHDGTAVLDIPRDCEQGDYELWVSRGRWCLYSVPFGITSRRVAEVGRQLFRAAVVQAEALETAQDPAGGVEIVVRLASEAERLYVACGEARWARRLWQDISDALGHRGLEGDAGEALARAQALEPRVQIAYLVAERGTAAEIRRGADTVAETGIVGETGTVVGTRTDAGTIARRSRFWGAALDSRSLARFSVGAEVSDLYKRFAPQLRVFLAQQSRLKHKVEDLLSDVFVSLMRYPPAQKLSRPDNYLWRIAWRLVNAANRGAREDEERMSQLCHEAPDWLLGRSGALSPADPVEWLAYRELIRRGLEQLSPEERTAVLLARMGYSYKESALRMQISVELLRKYLRRGYLTLKASRSGPEED